MSNIRPGRVLVVDDEVDIGIIIADVLEDAGFEVDKVTTGELGHEQLRTGAYDLAYVDINLPGLSGFDILDTAREEKIDTDIVIITGKATVAHAVEATRRGAYDYVTKPFDLDALLDLARTIMERRALSRRVEREQKPTSPTKSDDAVEIVGQSAAMQQVYKIIGRVAGSPTTVLIQGESGTGKEVIARAVHSYSTRADGPFVAVNCSAIPADLLESEMFGHERGAFTGATDRRVGKFEQAAGGTLFLDEICEMPSGLQAKLLRVIQEREFTRVGGHQVQATDCRIITATNRSIEAEVAAGRFREDLYFRLKVVVIDLPPLRERREDIRPLVDFFIDAINRDQHFDVKGFSPDALALLVSHSWPGNVRELENVLLRAAALAPNRVLTAADIPVKGSIGPAPVDDSNSLSDLVGKRVRDYLKSLGDTEPRNLHGSLVAMVEKPLFEAVLESTGGNQVRAAEILGINRNTLRKKITDHQIALEKI